MLKIVRTISTSVLRKNNQTSYVTKHARFNNKAPLKLAPSAIKQINHLLTKKEKAIGILLGVNRRGCNGYSYKMSYLYSKDLNKFANEIYQQDGVQFAVEPKSFLQIVGTEMHYEDSELSSEFRFINPNEKNKCGCGESFNI